VVDGRASPPTIARGAHATSVESVGTGNYRVFFDRNISNCAYVATIGLPGGVDTEEPGFITTVTALISANAVFVTTDNTTGASANRSFHLQVICNSAAVAASAQALQAKRQGRSKPLRKKPMLRANSPGRKGD
jgi:hypothetical protein